MSTINIWQRQNNLFELENHLSEFYSKFINIIDKNSQSNKILQYETNKSSSNQSNKILQLGINKILLSTSNINIIDLVKNHKPISAEQLKSYIIDMTSKLLNKKVHEKDFSKTFQNQKTSITQFIVNELNQPLLYLNNKYDLISNQLQSKINAKIDNFIHFIENKNIRTETFTSNGKTLNKNWPFINFSGSDNFEVEIDIIVKKNKTVDFQNNTNLLNYHYNVIIKSNNEYKMFISHRIYEGYLIKNILDKDNYLITEYNNYFQKNGFCIYYKNGNMKQIYHYNNDLLNGESLYIINNRVVFVIPFFKNNPHGTMIIADSLKNIVYTEIFFEGNTLLNFPILCNELN